MSVLQKYLKYILIVSQCFGILPMTGIYSDDPINLEFAWISWKILYTLCLMVATLFTLYMGIYNFCFYDFELKNLTVIIFFSNGLIVIILFLKLARDWPAFMCYWQNVEIFIRSKIILPNTFIYIPFVILGAAVVEHSLLIAFSITSEKSQKNITRFEIFMSRDSYIFNHLSYSWYLGVFIKFISFANTFYWNFMDIFVIVMSIALSTMLKMINYKIQTASEDKMATWVDIRRQYNKLCELSFRLENKISPIILMSFASNLYFILVQLHGSIKKRNTMMESVYFFFSFGMLLLRTLAVCLFAAKMDDESKTSLRLLSCLNTYNSESIRLLQQVSSMKLALSGMNFFTVTRGLILNIAAAIVTYEIFFIQYINTISE